MAKFNSIITVTLASGTTSSEIDVKGKSLYAIQTPASIASSTLSFQGASASGGTFAPVWDDAGAAVSITCASSQIVALPNKHMNLRAIPYLKLVTGTTETAKTFTMYFVDE